jgi:hypothetical protein
MRLGKVLLDTAGATVSGGTSSDTDGGHTHVHNVYLSQITGVVGLVVGTGTPLIDDTQIAEYLTRESTELVDKIWRENGLLYHMVDDDDGNGPQSTIMTLIDYANKSDYVLKEDQSLVGKLTTPGDYANGSDYALITAMDSKIKSNEDGNYANVSDYALITAMASKIKSNEDGNYANESAYVLITDMNSTTLGPKIKSGEDGGYANESAYLTVLQMDNGTAGGVGPKIKVDDYSQ